MSDHNERQPSDHAARLRALSPGDSFLVQAPAGSGKTELLTDRILALLPTVQRPEEIVAITFTRKAASEMHARVLQKLQRGRDDTPPQSEQACRSWTLARAALAHDRRQDWRLMDHPARLSIRTIDSFCAGLVRGMPWLTGLGGMPSLTDDARVHFDAAADATLAMADDYPAVSALLDHMDVDLGAAREALSGMLGHRDQWMPLLAHGFDRDAMASDLAEAVAEDLQALADEMPPGWAQALGPCARAAVAVLDEAGADHKLTALREWADTLHADPAYLAQWRGVAELLLTGTGSLRSPRGINKNLGFPAGCAHKPALVDWLTAADPGAPWVRLLARARELPDPGFTDAQWHILSAQLVSLTLAVAQLRVRFSQAGEVDFIEVSQRVTEALGDADTPGELLLKLDASIRHLLIDEFQDTSQSQIDLLEKLIAGWMPDDGRTLFLVGDPMQSIYRFRKAEVGLFLTVRDQGIGAIKPEFLRLTDNFRSQGGIVAWVNQWFASLMPQQDDAPTGAIAYTKARAFHPEAPGDAVRFHPAWCLGDTTAADARGEADVVALLNDIRASDSAGQQSVAILVRARSHLAGLARQLAQANIPYRAVELVPLASRPVVSDLVQLVRVLAHPADRLAWLTVLRAPWCGLTLDALHHLATAWPEATLPESIRRALSRALSADGQPVTWDADTLARLRRLHDAVLNDGLESGALPYAARLARMWRRLGGTHLYAGQHVEADAESFFALLERLAPYGHPDPDALDDAVGKLFATPETGPAMVDIMTMHKSKGLQFDHVVLYGLHRAPRGDTSPLVRFEQSGQRVLFGPVKARADAEHDPLSRYLALRERQRADYEVDRLLYVAATRARQRLHIVGQVVVDPANGTVKPPAAASLLGRLWPAVAVAVPPNLPREEGVAGPVAECVGRPLARLSADSLRQVPRGHADEIGNTGADLPAHHAAPVSAWSVEPTYDAAVGTLAHAWLDRLGREGTHIWAAVERQARLPQLERQLTRAGVPEAAAADAAQAVWETLEATLADERGRWLLAQAGARREWPLIDAAGKVSVIDLALSTEAGWLIVDFKTGKPHPDESPEGFARRMRARHADQLRRYCAQVTALDQRPARAALYFPRASLWLSLEA